jgi:pSer/pThr/pTyr-binding forkhead associated (FHA) protein
MARTDGHGGSRPSTGDIQAGDRPKTSGFYERGPAAEGGWGFVLPRENGNIDVIAARNAAVIGSSDDADVQILGPEVAPQHARVEVRADGVYLEDLESPGGTFVGGVRARRIGMAHGDIVRFGNQLAVFVEHGLVRYKGRIDLGEPLVIGPRDRSAFVDPALDYARAGQSFVIEGGPGLGKRTLAQMAAGQRAEQGPIVTVDAGDAPAEAFADAREEQPATWILVNAERLPRAVQVEVGQILARTAGSIARPRARRQHGGAGVRDDLQRPASHDPAAVGAP